MSSRRRYTRYRCTPLSACLAAPSADVAGAGEFLELLQLEEAKQQEETLALYELLQRQRVDIRALMSSQRKLQAELESVQSELADQRRQNQQLRYQLLTLRKLRSAERAKQHKTLERAELRLEKELEKYMVLPDASWRTSDETSHSSGIKEVQNSNIRSSVQSPRISPASSSRTLSTAQPGKSHLQLQSPVGASSSVLEIKNSAPMSSLSKSLLKTPACPSASAGPSVLPSIQIVNASRLNSPAPTSVEAPTFKKSQLAPQTMAPGKSAISPALSSLLKSSAAILAKSAQGGGSVASSSAHPALPQASTLLNK